MALNPCKMWSKEIKIYFFSKNLQKSHSGWGLCPQTPIAIGGWGLYPSPKLDTLHFLTISFHPLPLPKSWSSAKRATASNLSFYDMFAPQKVPVLKISDDVIACDL